jgi:hypothetical protein
LTPTPWGESATLRNAQPLPKPAAAKAAAAKPVAAKPVAKGKLFATPEEARDALVSAATAKEDAALAAIFGPDHDKMKTGDPEEDRRHAERFALHVQEGCNLNKVSDQKYTLLIGLRQYPFAVPIVKDGDKWRFDTEAGIQEILHRRIGSNELSAIMTCRAYVLAQWEFFTQGGNHNEDGLAEYAQKFASTPGVHDGLYWEAGPDEDPSPLGALVAAAGTDATSAGHPGQGASVKPASASAKGEAGAAAQAATLPRAPYHGYYFKILTRQGPAAPSAI